MASFHQLRQLDERPRETGGRFSLARERSPLVASLTLLVTAIAASLATVAIVGGLRSSAGPAPFVSRALGPHDPSFLLDRRWDDLTRVSIAGGGVAVRHDGTALKLTATGTGSAPWTRHAWGVERPTTFGRESIVVAAPRTEEYLTVQRRVGPRTWRWRLESRKSVPRLEADGSLSLTTAGARAGVRVLPPVVFDAAGRDVTPQGTHWSLERRGSSRFLALRVDDSSLPLPYVIDPITVVGSPGGTGSGNTSPLTITKPAGVATGNLMVATVSLRDSTATMTPPTGWSLLTSIASSGGTTAQYVYAKVATGAEPASYAFSWAGGSGASDSSGVILAYAGIWAGAGSNIDATTSATANATTTAATAAGTASYAQDMILALYGAAGSSSFTTPAGMTVRATAASSTGAPATRSATGTFDVIQAASGAIAAKSSTITSHDETAIMVAIRPAAAIASAAKSTLTASPTSILADGTTTSTLRATIKDTNGNPLPGKTVTLAKSSGSSTITTVSGTTDALGQATFTVNDSAVESTVYTATDATDAITVTQTATVTFTVGPVTAAQSTVAAAPASVTANGVATSTVTVTLKDAQSHPVAGKTVTLAKGGGSSTITTVSGVTNAAGVATFTVKDTVAEATVYTATDTTDTVTVTQTATVTFTAGPVAAAKSTVSAAPASIVADGSTTSTVTVTLKDAQSNPVSGKTVTLAKGSGSSTITTVASVTNAAGAATFTVKDSAAEATTYTATDTTDSVTVTQTAVVNFTAGAVTAAQSTVSAAPASVTANGVTTSTVTVTLKDVNSNSVPGKTVTLAKGGGSSTITTVSGVTNAAGVATFTVKDTVAEATVYTATDTTDTVTVTQTATVTFTAGPVAAAKSTVSAAPASIVADGSTTSTVTVTLKDAQSNPVSGKTVTLAKGSGSSTITTVAGTTNAAGAATFTVKDSAVESTVYTATDTTDAITVTQTATVTFTVGPVTAAQSTVAAAPASVTANGVATSTVTVTLKDAQSHPVAGKTVTLAKGGGSSTITTVSGVTNAAGVATFTVKDTVAEATVYTATDTTDTVTVTQTATVTFTAGPVAAAKSTVSAAPASIVADGSTTSTVTVTLKDAQSNPVSGKTVTLAKGSGSSTITTVASVTNAAGAATFTVKDSAVESTVYTATDTTDAITVTQTATVTFTVGPVTAAQSTVAAAPASVTANGVATSTVTVTLKDAQSHPVAGKTVTLAKGGGSSTITTVSGVTNAAGVATFTVKDTVAEATVYTATDTTDTVTVTQTATVTFTAGPVAAAKSTVSAAPASIVADGSTTSTVTVTLKDAQSNPVSGKTVTLAKGSGSSTITTVASVTNAAGAATFTVKDSAVESTVYTATDTTDAITVTQTASVSFTAGAVDATSSTVAAAPSSVLANGAAGSTITVTAKDAFAHLLAGQPVTLAQGAGSSTITVVSGVTNAAGVATFTTTNTLAQAVTYTATIGVTPILQTAGVTYTPGPATHISVSAPGTSTAGSLFNVTLTALDANNNTATAYTGTVHFTSSDGQAGLPANYTFTGADNGSHTFSNATTLKTAGSKTVVATDTVTATMTGTTNLTVNPAAANATASTLTATPSSIVADGATTSTLTATINDAYGNPLAGKTVTLTKGSGNSTITTSTGTTNAAGQATFSVKDTTAEATTYTATDTTDTLTLTQTATVTFTAGPVTAAQSTVSAAPASVTADGSATATVTVTLRDAQSNPVSGKTVTLAKGSGFSTITTVSGVTNASGVATFTVNDVVAETTTYTATDATDSVTVTQTAAVMFVAGNVSAAQSTLSASPASVTADDVTPSMLTATLLDAQGNPVAGKTVTLGKSGGSSSIATVNAVTDASGAARFSVTDAVAETTTYTATDTTDSLTVTQTASVAFTSGAVSAVQSTVAAAPGSVTADGTSSATVTVTARDAFGNPVAAQVVTIGQGAGSSTITPVSGTTNGSGVATFSVGSTTAETVTYSVSVGVTALLQTAQVVFTPGPATQLAFGQQPTNTLSGATIAPAVTVRLLDAHNNLTSSTASVSLAIKSGTGALGATLTGTVSRNAVAGVVTFNDLSIAQAATGYRLTAQSTGLAGADSAPFDETVGAIAAGHTTISASPSAIDADGASTSTITVRARDANDNGLTGGGATVVLSTTLGTLGSVSDNGDGTYSATLTAGLTSGSAQVTGTINGSTIGNPATVTFQPQPTSVVVDTGAPPAQTQSTGITVAFHSDDTNATFACSLDGEPFAACISPTTRSGLADGAHTLRIHAVNGNGTNPDATIAWTIDTQAPNVAFTTVPGPYTKNASELLVASASDATTAVGNVTFRYGANAAACTTGTLIFTDTGAPYSITWTTPADGTYVVCAIATDSVGKTAQANASVTVDQTAPGGTFPAVGTTVGSDRYVRGAVALHATGTDATSLVDTVEFLADATSLATVSAAPYDATWNTTGDGPTTLGAVITDRAGNTTTLTQPVIRDNTPPTATLDNPGQWGHGTIPLSVTASDPGSGVDTAAITIGQSTDGGGSWSPIASPATWTPADGTYELRAVVPDKVGNSTTTGTRTILVDNTAPTVGDNADANWHNASVTIALTGVDAESGVALPSGLEYKVDGGSFTAGSSVVVPAPANGSNDGTHTITYHATNRAGVTSADKTAIVKIDATAPNNVTLDSPAAAALLRASVPLAATAQDATAGIASTTFRLVAGTLAAGSCATSGSAITSPFDTTTVADGHYDLWVAAVDTAGNGRCSVTPHDVVIDNTRPVTTDNAPSGAQNNDVTVNLAATDNLSGVDVTEYSLDGGAHWTTGPSVTVLASSGDGTTTITYRSRDLAGNVELAKSTSVTIDTTAPAGGVNDPGSVLHGTVSLTASPSDPDVASVQFLYRPAGPGAYTLIGTDTTAPYDVPWITTGPSTPDGLYDLEIIVTDTAGNTTTVALSAKTIDNTSPDSAAVTAPAGGANVGGSTVALAATASDATSGVASVAFEVKPTGASSFTTVDADTNGAPFTGVWSPAPGVPDGPVDVRVAATDLAGNGPTYSPVSSFTLDRTNPAVTLTVPTPVSASAALSATGSADIDHLVYAYSGDGGSTWTPIGTGNGPSPYGITWTTPLTDGSYQVRATAFDGGGNQGTDVQTVQVDRTAPLGALTQPAPAATVGGANVSVAATASDPGGSGVASVTFRYRPAGGGAFTTIATDPTAPFATTWDVTGVSSGSYDVQAVILDAAGNTKLDLSTVTVDSVSGANAAPRDFAAVIADDGLTLRWAPGIPQVRNFVLYADGIAIAQFGGEQFETKLGQITADDARRFTLTELNSLGIESAHTPVLRAVPALAGLSQAAAAQALAGRGFTVGRVVQVAAPGIPAGTVVGPTGVHVQEEGSSVDIQVASGAARSPFALRIAIAPTAHRSSRSLAARVSITDRARVDVTLDAKPFRRMQRWHFFHVKAGATILTLKLLHTLPAGTYDLHWKATSDATKVVQRKITTIRVVATTRSRSQNVVSISGGRTTQGLTKGLKHVSHLTPDQAFLYASYHDVRVFVVDADLYGPALARDLHQVFPSATVVALSKNVGRRAALTSNGIVAVPASTPQAQVAALVARLLRGLNL